jgi:hypothetical protein
VDLGVLTVALHDIIKVATTNPNIKNDFFIILIFN